MQCFRQYVRLCRIVVETNPGCIRVEMRRLGIEPGAVIAAKFRVADAPAFIEHQLMIAVHRPLWTVVHLADTHCVVAGITHGLRFGLRVTLAHLNHVQHAVIPRRQTGEQSAARGRAGGSGGVGASEAHTFLANAIDVGGVDRLIAIGTCAVAPVLVVHDEQDVGA